MPRRALVTGGCGFIGSNLVKELVKQGWIVDVVDNMSNGDIGLLEDIRDLRILPNASFLHAYKQQEIERTNDKILVIEDENRTCSCVFIACARVYVVYSYSMLYSASESVSSTTSFSSTGAKSCSCIFSLVCIASTNCSTIVLSSPTTLETFDAISFA